MSKQYILFFFGILGAFNGLLLGIYFMFVLRTRSLVNYFLGFLLMVLSIRIGKSVFVYFNPNLAKIYLQIGLSACFLIGPALYYYVRSFLTQPVKMPSSWKWTISGLSALIILFGILYPYAVYSRLWSQYVIRIIYGEWFLYVAVTVFHLSTIAWRRLSAEGTDRFKPGEKWLLTIVAINVIIFLTYFLAMAVKPSFLLYYSGSVIFSCCLYAVILFLLIRKQTGLLLNPSVFSAKPVTRKVYNGDVSLILNRVENLMIDQKIFKDPHLNLTELAKVVGVSGHQLSAILNDHAGKNFTTFVNEYRISEACSMITANHPFSLEAIGYEVGFNSKSTFYTAFKKLKATTPSLYKESMTKTASV